MKLTLLSSFADHDSSELLWDDELNQEDHDLFGVDYSGEDDGDDVGGGGVYGCVRFSWLLSSPTF